MAEQMTAEERRHHLTPDLGVLRAEYLVVLLGKVQESVRARAVFRRGQSRFGERLVPLPQRLSDRDSVVLVAGYHDHRCADVTELVVWRIGMRHLRCHLL